MERLTLYNSVGIEVVTLITSIFANGSTRTYRVILNGVTGTLRELVNESKVYELTANLALNDNELKGILPNFKRTIIRRNCFSV